MDHALGAARSAGERRLKHREVEQVEVAVVIDVGQGAGRITVRRRIARCRARPGQTTGEAAVLSGAARDVVSVGHAVAVAVV